MLKLRDPLQDPGRRGFRVGLIARGAGHRGDPERRHRGPGGPGRRLSIRAPSQLGAELRQLAIDLLDPLQVGVEQAGVVLLDLADQPPETLRLPIVQT